jgi:hypothetical protein
LVAAAYAPSQVSAKVANGVEVAIVEDTEYPFRGTVRMTVYPSAAAKFPLVLRIPAWAEGATITVQGQAQAGIKAGTFHTVDREWKSGDVVELTFPMNLNVTRWYRDGVAINRGPLVFSLAMGEDWKKVKGEEPHADWEVHPTTPWNIALTLDPENPAASLIIEERPVGDAAFSPEGAPLRMKAKGRKVSEWTLVKGSAGPLPQSPVKTSAPEEDLTLIPYGCTNLRVTVFPLAAPQAAGKAGL